MRGNRNISRVNHIVNGLKDKKLENISIQNNIIKKIPEPHGGRLVNRIFESKNNNTNDMFSIELDDNLRNDVENIGDGIFSPLEGFIGQSDFDSVLKCGRLRNGLPWTIPIVLDVEESMAKKIQDYREISLKNKGEHFATLYFDEFYSFDKLEMVRALYLTDDEQHPGVSKTFKMKDYLVSGRISVSKKINNFKLRNYRLEPIKTREEIKRRGWKTMVGFQTRNIPHIAHEMLQKAALNIYDGLFLNPLIGKKKTGDFKDEVILESYKKLIENYYPQERVMFVTLHTEMRYAGPKEAIHHAIMRKNFGCSHFIVGRDHAGVGNYYRPFAAHEIFGEYADIGIEPIFFPSFYYCNKCLGYANDRNCPHGSEFKEELSGTRMRKMVSSGEMPGKHLMRPEIADVIINFQDPFVS
ncbi:MAG TPA: sulfate adenylyltransferase [Nitrososphaeraceae archaeon]|nr:sulfate adenylyltransferase [Nitrososphaeraceae archaeon]